MLLLALSNLPQQVPGHVTGVFFLEVWSSPILTCDYLATTGRSTFTFHLVSVVVCGRPIVGQLFAAGNVSQGNKNDLPLHTNVWLTRVIAEDHAALSFLFIERTDKQILVYLDFRRPEPPSNLLKRFAVEDIAALDANNLAAFDRLDCEQTPALNWALFYSRLR